VDAGAVPRPGAGGVTDLESFTFVLLRRPPGAPALPDDELERIQREHLAFLDRMRAEGALLAAGPFSEQPDESLRGLCFYRTSPDETRERVQHDPAVRAGRLVADVMRWSTPRGALSLLAAERGQPPV
jgi:uncharacterized protein YciI